MIPALLVFGVPAWGLMFTSKALRPFRLFFVVFAVGLALTPSFVWAPVAAVIAIVNLSRRFTRHYIHLGTASPTDRKTAEGFRNRFEVPPGISPGSALFAFFDALISWLTYDAGQAALPGTLRSPAGSQPKRLILSALTVTLVALSGPGVLAVVPFHATGEITPYLVAGASTVASLPTTVLALFVLSAPSLRWAYAMKGHAKVQNYWHRFVNDMKDSSDKLEQNAFYFGRVVHDGSPILVQGKTLGSHTWVLGTTGSGKTTQLLSLTDQLIARGYSLIYVDLKADDYAVLHAMMDARKRFGLSCPLWYLTNREGHASHLFLPQRQTWWNRLSATQWTDVQLGAMGLLFSRAYGESFYTDASYALLNQVNAAHPDASSFRQLADALVHEVRNTSDGDLISLLKNDSTHVRIVLERIAKQDLFKVPFDQPAAVDGAVEMERFFTGQALMYCAFSTLLSPLTSPETARMVVSSLLTAATTIRERNTPVALVIDEFQQLVAPGTVQLLLRQSRSLGISVILTNQTASDLQLGQFDLSGTVVGNTCVQAFHKVQDDVGLRLLEALSGLTLETIPQLTAAYGAEETKYQITYTRHRVPRFESQDILSLGASPRQFLIRITRNEDPGYCQYGGLMFPAESDYTMSKTEYDQLVGRPWPSVTPDTIVVGSSAPVEQPPPSPRPDPLRPNTPLRTGSLKGTA
jgi:hypothetical protein